MLKGSDTIFRVYLRPLPMVVWHHIALEYILHILFVQVFRFWREWCIFRFHNEAAHDPETYNFIEQLLEAPVGCLGSVKTFWYSAWNMLILDILNNTSDGTFGRLRAPIDGYGSDVLFPCDYCKLAFYDSFDCKYPTGSLNGGLINFSTKIIVLMRCNLKCVFYTDK